MDHQGRPVVVDRYDGDTFQMAVVPSETTDTYMGYVPWLRPTGMDAPERGDEGWAEAEAYAIELITEARQVTVTFLGWSFDRQLCRVTLYSHRFAYGVDFADAMIAAGHARPSAE